MQPIKGGNRLLYYHEIFASIQGESTDVGIPTIFVRLYGCPLNCSYCDQPQLPSDRRRISAGNMINEIRNLRLNTVCITGGEPLMQPEIYVVIYELVDRGYNVSIETNGNVLIPKDNYLRSFKYVMDIKCPSSNESNKNKYENLGNLLCKDEVKFVIADKNDYEFAKKMLKKYPTRATKIFSPMFNKNQKQTIGQELSNWVIEDNMPNTRVGVQIHKLLKVR